jgi:putative SOS response-associated peptidase YedK
MCNLYSITTNQATIIALFPGHQQIRRQPAADARVLPDYPAPAVHNAGAEREMVLMRWGMPPSEVESLRRGPHPR